MKLDTRNRARDKDIHCCPSIDCKYHLKYDLCSSPEAPKPNHNRCIGSRLCEEWQLQS